MSEPLAAARPPLYWRYLGFIGLCVLGACMLVWRTQAPPTDVGTEKRSASGRYLVRLHPQRQPIPVRTFHEWTVVIRPADSTAALTPSLAPVFDGRMPMHRHGLPSKPHTVAGASDGEYVVEGVKFSMGGWWRLVVRLSTASGPDSVVFNLDL